MEFELPYPAFAVVELDSEFGLGEPLLLTDSHTRSEGFAIFSERLQAERARDEHLPRAQVIPIPDETNLKTFLRLMRAEFPEINYVAADPSYPTSDRTVGAMWISIQEIIDRDN